MYQHCNMTPRLSEKTSKFGVVSIVSKSLLEETKKIYNFDPKASDSC